jgi:hypothetical protein
MPEPDSGSRFRIVRPEPQPPRMHGPGLAVIAIAVYALLFLVALIALRNRIGSAPTGPPAPASPSIPSAAASPVLVDRVALLSGEELPSDVRSEYARRLSEDCCDCGCDLTIRRCLATDARCRRSAEVASRWLTELR